jgi:hypothetical protein
MQISFVFQSLTSKVLTDSSYRSESSYVHQANGASDVLYDALVCFNSISDKFHIVVQAIQVMGHVILLLLGCLIF